MNKFIYYDFVSLIYYHFCGNCYLSIHAFITCLVYDLNALRVVQKIQIMVSCKMINCSQLVHGIRQSIKYCTTLPSNLRVDLLGHCDDFSMVSTLVCMVTHWTEPVVHYNIDYQVVMIQQATIVYKLSTCENIEIVLRFLLALTYR